MSDTNSEEKVFFLFSRDEYKFKMELANKLHRTYVPDEVLVNGTFKQFTNKVTDMENSRYSDSILIASGELSKMKIKKGRL